MNFEMIPIWNTTQPLHKEGETGKLHVNMI